MPLGALIGAPSAHHNIHLTGFDQTRPQRRFTDAPSPHSELRHA
ncbi:MAG: hypothetical protein P8R54_01385 [Myxococcota bacterium]|nr:hypothetical protein [Myxococcota bacterium]